MVFTLGGLGLGLTFSRPSITGVTPLVPDPISAPALFYMTLPPPSSFCFWVATPVLRWHPTLRKTVLASRKKNPLGSSIALEPHARRRSPCIHPQRISLGSLSYNMGRTGGKFYNASRHIALLSSLAPLIAILVYFSRLCIGLSALFGSMVSPRGSTRG